MEQLHWLASSPCLAYSVQDTGIVISYCILGKSLRRVQVLRAQWCVHEPCQPQAAFLSGSRSERADEAPSFPSVCTNDHLYFRESLRDFQGLGYLFGPYHPQA